MKIAVVIISIAFCCLPCLMAYSPLVEPDTAYLPFLLDSTQFHEWDADSNKFIMNESRMYSYDEKGILTNYEIFTREGFHSLIPHGKRDATFVCSHAGDARTIANYDAISNTWDYTLFHWRPALNNWEHAVRFLFTFDAYRNITEFYLFRWDSIHTDWVEDTRDVYTYDEKGNQTEHVWDSWNSDQNNWTEESRNRNAYTYDANGNQTECIEYYWSYDQNDWEENNRYVYIYDADGSQTEYITFNWIYDQNDWEENDRYVYMYDANGNQTELIESFWNPDQNDWEEDYRNVYIYDANGSQTECTRYKWDTTMIAWKERIKEYYTYDEDSNLTEQSFHYWNQEQNDWRIYEKALAFWSGITVNTTPIRDKIRCRIYPNPVANSLTIELDQSKACHLEVHSLNGTLMYGTHMKQPVLRINTSDFERGLYLITIRSKDFVETRKIIKL